MRFPDVHSVDVRTYDRILVSARILDSGMGAHHRFFACWALATFAGWVLGVFLIAAVLAITEPFHLGGDTAIGIGMGLGVGFAQWLVIRKRFGASTQWMWASTAGLALPFIAYDLVGKTSGKDWLIIPLAGCGGLLASAWQRRALRTRGFTISWWTVAGVAGWTLGAALPAAFVIPGPHLSNIIAILAGGASLAFVTGLAWMRALNRADVASAAAS